MVKKVACFFTGGYTESNAMPGFLSKINNKVQFKQFCPNRTKKRKCPGLDKDLIDEVSGLTGPALLRYVYTYLTKHSAEVSDFDAVIIEDDLDGRFYEELIPGKKESRVSRRTREFENRCGEVAKTVREKLGKDESFPVIQFFASPEMETWFLADWDHTFGLIYGPKGISVLTLEENNFFSNRFQTYLNKFVLLTYADQIENYGYICGVYKKLSDEIIASYDTFKIMLESPKETFPFAREIAENQSLNYKKKLHGDFMLQCLSPDMVWQKCPIYFREAFKQLKEL